MELKLFSLSHSDWSIVGVCYLVAMDLVLVDLALIQGGTVSVLVMEPVVPDPSIETVVMVTVAAGVVVDPDSFDLYSLDFDLTSSQTCFHSMVSQESYQKRVHPIHHYALNHSMDHVVVLQFVEEPQSVLVPFLAGFGTLSVIPDHLETRLAVL